MARRRFNPRQPRDKHGRWTSRGGSFRASTRRGRGGSRRADALMAVAPIAFAGHRAIKSAKLIAAARTVGMGSSAGFALLGVSAGASLYLSTRTARQKYLHPAVQKRVSSKNYQRFVKTERFVDRTASVVAITAGFGSGSGRIATKVRGTIFNKAANARAGNSFANGLGSMRMPKAGRGGVYNISSMKGRRVK